MNVNETGFMAGVSRGMRRLAAAIAALSLVVVLSLMGSMQAAPQAYASIYPASEAAAAVDDQASGSAAAADDQAAQEEEAIEDEETPMSSGLGGGEPLAAAGMSFQWVIIAGIVAVVAFFAASTLRLNKNITKMRNRLK